METNKNTPENDGNTNEMPTALTAVQEVCSQEAVPEKQDVLTTMKKMMLIIIQIRKIILLGKALPRLLILRNSPTFNELQTAGK